MESAPIAGSKSLRPRIAPRWTSTKVAGEKFAGLKPRQTPSPAPTTSERTKRATAWKSVVKKPEADRLILSCGWLRLGETTCYSSEASKYSDNVIQMARPVKRSPGNMCPRICTRQAAENARACFEGARAAFVQHSWQKATIAMIAQMSGVSAETVLRDVRQQAGHAPSGDRKSRYG